MVRLDFLHLSRNYHPTLLAFSEPVARRRTTPVPSRQAYARLCLFIFALRQSAGRPVHTQEQVQEQECAVVETVEKVERSLVGPRNQNVRSERL